MRPGAHSVLFAQMLGIVPGAIGHIPSATQKPTRPANSFIPGPVVALSFGESPSGQTRLFSLGADGRALEFDLRSTSALRIAAAHDAAAPVGGAPSALCFAPPMPYWAKSSTETLLLVAGTGDGTPAGGCLLQEQNPVCCISCLSQLLAAANPDGNPVVMMETTLAAGTDFQVPCGCLNSALH